MQLKRGSLLPLWAISAARRRSCANMPRRRRNTATTLSRRPTTCSASTRRAGRGGTATHHADLFHDPFVLFGYLAGVTPNLGFSTGVLILAQRQTVLVAKQAACLDVLCGGRFRLGVGVGWNETEFVGLNENFRNRGRRSEEQVQVMQKLWAEPHVDFTGKWHRIEDAGINPRPKSGRVPVWFGGHHERTLDRIAKWGDGWMPNAYPADQSALDIFADLRRRIEAAGRDPAAVGIEVWTSMGSGSEADWRARKQNSGNRPARRISA